MVGAVPFGYRVENHALRIVEEYAEFLRDLFRRCLETDSAVRLKAVLDAANLSGSICWTGRAAGGGLISRCHVYHMLSNRSA
jgi:hypothetical protein